MEKIYSPSMTSRQKESPITPRILKKYSRPQSPKTDLYSKKSFLPPYLPLLPPGNPGLFKQIDGETSL
jgi:hypothetical protein